MLWPNYLSIQGLYSIKIRFPSTGVPQDFQRCFKITDLFGVFVGYNIQNFWATLSQGRVPVRESMLIELYVGAAPKMAPLWSTPLIATAQSTALT